MKLLICQLYASPSCMHHQMFYMQPGKYVERILSIFSKASFVHILLIPTARASQKCVGQRHASAILLCFEFWQPIKMNAVIVNIVWDFPDLSLQLRFKIFWICVFWLLLLWIEIIRRREEDLFLYIKHNLFLEVSIMWETQIYILRCRITSAWVFCIIKIKIKIE